MRRHNMREGLRRRAAVFILSSIALFATSISAFAHHAVQSEFDQNNRKLLTGKITKVLWVNPHVRWVMEVKNPKTGKIETWDLSGGGPAGFRAVGLANKSVFKIGETYGAWVALARDGSNAGHVFAFVMPD